MDDIIFINSIIIYTKYIVLIVSIRVSHFVFLTQVLTDKKHYTYLIIY